MRKYGPASKSFGGKNQTVHMVGSATQLIFVLGLVLAVAFACDAGSEAEAPDHGASSPATDEKRNAGERIAEASRRETIVLHIEGMAKTPAGFT